MFMVFIHFREHSAMDCLWFADFMEPCRHQSVLWSMRGRSCGVVRPMHRYGSDCPRMLHGSAVAHSEEGMVSASSGGGSRLRLAVYVNG